MILLISAFLLPGLAFLPRWREEHALTLWVRVTSISVATTILTSLAAALVGIPQLAVFIVLLVTTMSLLWWQRAELLQIKDWYRLVAPLCIFFLSLLLFSLPWLFVHDGLPTGDIQKSLIWANEIITTHHLPSYQQATTLYNRDPVDFYTPGLHSLLAYVLTGSPENVAAGFFSIAIALLGAGIGAALALELFSTQPAWLMTGATTWLILTNLRWLRYLREPGYHIQNSVGELLLFGLLLWLLTLLKKWNWFNAIACALMLFALPLTHQFSAFMAGFVLLPFLVAIIATYLRHHHSWRQLAGLCSTIVLIVVIALVAGLQEKIPHIFFRYTPSS